MPLNTDSALAATQVRKANQVATVPSFVGTRKGVDPNQSALLSINLGEGFTNHARQVLWAELAQIVRWSKLEQVFPFLIAHQIAVAIELFANFSEQRELFLLLFGQDRSERPHHRQHPLVTKCRILLPKCLCDRFCLIRGIDKEHSVVADMTSPNISHSHRTHLVPQLLTFPI